MALAVFGDQIWIAKHFLIPISSLSPLRSASQYTPIGDAIVSLAPDGWELLRLFGEKGIIWRIGYKPPWFSGQEHLTGNQKVDDFFHLSDCSKLNVLLVVKIKMIEYFC